MTWAIGGDKPQEPTDEELMDEFIDDMSGYLQPLNAQPYLQIVNDPGLIYFGTNADLIPLSELQDASR